MKPTAYKWRTSEGIEFLSHDSAPMIASGEPTPLYAIPNGFKLVPIKLSARWKEELTDIVIGSANGEQVWDRFIPMLPSIEEIE